MNNMNDVFNYAHLESLIKAKKKYIAAFKSFEKDSGIQVCESGFDSIQLYGEPGKAFIMQCNKAESKIVTNGEASYLELSVKIQGLRIFVLVK